MDWLCFVVSVTVSLVVVLISLAECGRLNDYILDYQPLIYDRRTIHTNHQRVRRSIDSHLKIRFNAYGRDFQLTLQPSEGVFGAHHLVYTDGVGPHQVDTSFIYQGQVKGEPTSWVHLSVHDGRLEGQVEMPDTTYHIEPAAKYMKGKDPTVHTIIYPETHLDADPYRHRHQGDGAHCGVDHAAIKEFMDKASQLQEEPPLKPSVHARASSPGEQSRKPHNIYTMESNREKRSVDSHTPYSRHKRSLGSRNACSLHMRADPMLFNFTKYQKHGKTITDKEAEEDILAFFSSHVSAISRIYSGTVFQTYSGEQQNTGLSFVIYRSTVMRNCSGEWSDYYCKNSLDVSNYLDLTSEDNHDDYCLAFTFTYRDFSGGTLGLAWVAAINSPQSGACGRHSTFTGGRKKSLNTGIVTIINFGRTVPNPVSQLTFAHEVGHNFGSPHDTGSEECAPFGTSRSDASRGNYIMFPSATSGDKPNNDEFSVCSRDNMTRIINQVIEGGARVNCFVESGQAFCGNKITEGTEQCDCGFDPCDQSTCCVGRLPNDPKSGCKLIPNMQCSPNSGPCCQTNCFFVAAATNKTCADESACKTRAACNGNTFSCPEPAHKPNGTYCNDYSKICISGECIGPVCSKIQDSRKWEECFQTSENSNSQNGLCFVACKNPTTQECVSSKDSDALAKVENSPFKVMLENARQERYGRNDSSTGVAIQLPAGSACDNFRGYCDTFSKCQRIDAQGPFNQLTNMIFNPVNFKIVQDWIVEHWWAVILIALGVVFMMGVFIKIFGYNTPSQNPKHQQRRRQQQQPQQQRQPRQSRQSQPRGGGHP